MKVLDAAKIARQRFNRDAWLGYYGNGWIGPLPEWPQNSVSALDVGYDL